MHELFYSNCPVPNAFLVAIHRFEDELADRGVRLSVLPSQNSATHFSGDLEGYFRFGGEIPPMITQGLRAPNTTRLLGLTRLRGMQGYFCRADDDRIRSAADLKGKKVGLAYNAIALYKGYDRAEYLAMGPWEQTMIALGTWEARGLDHSLARGGLTINDIEIVETKNPWSISLEEAEAAPSHCPKDLFRNTDQPDSNPQVAALLGGEIDVMFSFLPYAGELSARTDVRLVEDLCPAPEDDWISTFTVSTPLVERHPEAVQAVVDVTLMAAEWAKSHPEDVVAIHAENLAVRPESIRLGYGADVHETLVPELSPSAIATLNQTQDYLLKHKLLDERIGIAAWSEPRFLESALAAAA